nr:unnamed protein product [Callosobruchus analis]
MENDSPSDIVIVPPENANNENTNEDSGDEDDVILDNLPGSQLLAEAEVLHDSTAADTEVSADGFDSEDDLPLSTFGTRVVESKVAKKSRNYKWNNRDIESDILAFVPPYGPKRLYTPLEAFFLFFDNEVIGILVQYSNMYASSHNCVGDITEDEICCFLGVLNPIRVQPLFFQISIKNLVWVPLWF